MEEINKQEQVEDVVEDAQQTNEQVKNVHTMVSEDKQDVVEEKIYTQVDIDALQSQIDELLQYKPKELTENEINIQQKLEAIWVREINQILKEEGLEIFADFIKAEVDDTDSLHKQITKLKETVGKLELSNSYQPTNHKPIDAYSIAKKNKDAKSMIGAKLSF